MYVEFGNAHAIEGYRDPASDDPERVMYRRVEGQRVTSLVFPEGIGLQEAFTTAVAALGHHIEPGQVPSWIQADNPALLTLLCEHYHIPEDKNVRPPAWGSLSDDGAPAPKKSTRKRSGSR